MFYIRTADKLQRTARWLEALPGGIKYLQDVVLHDKLGICASLEAQMQELVDSFFDEWAEAVQNPEIAAKFRQFANSDDGVDNMETEQDRSQTRPVMWAKEPATTDFRGLRDRWSSLAWQPVIEAAHFAGADDTPNGISANIKRGDTQLALWRVRGRYYATQQMCPHKRAFALSDGLIGQDPAPPQALPPSPPPSPPSSAASSSGEASDSEEGPTPPTPATPREDERERSGEGEGEGEGEEQEPCGDRRTPWVSCPYHKRNFDLGSGACRTDGALSIATFDAEERADGLVYLRLPPVEELDRELGTSRWRVRRGEAGAPQFADLDRALDAQRRRRDDCKGRRARRPGAPEPEPRAPPQALPPGGGMASGGGCGGAGGLDW